MENNLKEIRSHEMYRVLLGTSNLYQKELGSMLININNEELLRQNQERAQLISDVLAEVCGLTRQRFGNIENYEES